MEAVAKTPRLLIIDTNALAHRAFHAFPMEWQTKRGEPTNAIYGFAAMLLQVLKTLKPDYVIAARDSAGATFRHDKYKEYKANRPKLDEQLAVQLPKITELIETLKIPVIAQKGYEADDIIGSICKSPSYKDFEKVIVTGDRDLFQVLEDNTKIYMAGSSFSKSQLYDIEGATTKMGFPPDHLVDYKALRGDNSDNIPGVNGIGEVTAMDLISRFHTLDNVYANLDKVKPAVRIKLEQGKDFAYLSKELAQIHYEVPVVLDLDNSELQDLDFNELKKLFEYYEFRSLVSRLRDFIAPVAGEAPVNLFNTLAAPPTDTKFTNHDINSGAEIAALIKAVAAADSVVFNCEPVSNIFQKPGHIYFALNQEVYTLNAVGLDAAQLKALEVIFTGGKLIVFDAKLAIHAALSLGIKEFNYKQDLSLIDYLLRGGSGKFGFEAALQRHLNIKVEQNLQASLFAEDQYCAQTYQTLLLSKKLLNEFEIATTGTKWDLKNLYQTVELPLTKVLATVERNGIKLDPKVLLDFSEELTQQISQLEKEIYAAAGENFNISSPKQLAHILYDKIKIPVGKKTKGGAYSTNEKVLLNNAIAFPIIGNILSYRELFKLKSTYTNTLIEQINKETGRVHTTFNQAIVATGRLSSTNPNLQNIPTSTELGQRIRRAFIADSGKKLISFDYAQQELRLLAHLSHEDKLLQAFVEGIDIHAATAAQIFHKDVKEVDRNQRRIGKTVNFGVVYGISPFGLADQLKISTTEASAFIEAFYASYPKVRSYFDQLKADARNTGFVETLYGRRRDASGLNTPNFQLRSAAEREIINFPLQGSAADIMKIAMINAQKAVDQSFSDFAKMVLQVHDELIFEYQDGDSKTLKEFTTEIADLMANVIKLDVPMNVSSNTGNNWGELK